MRVYKATVFRLKRPLKLTFKFWTNRFSTLWHFVLINISFSLIFFCHKFSNFFGFFFVQFFLFFQIFIDCFFYFYFQTFIYTFSSLLTVSFIITQSHLVVAAFFILKNTLCFCNRDEEKEVFSPPIFASFGFLLFTHFQNKELTGDWTTETIYIWEFSLPFFVPKITPKIQK